MPLIIQKIPIFDFSSDFSLPFRSDFFPRVPFIIDHCFRRFLISRGNRRSSPIFFFLSFRVLWTPSLLRFNHLTDFIFSILKTFKVFLLSGSTCKTRTFSMSVSSTVSCLRTLLYIFSMKWSVGFNIVCLFFPPPLTRGVLIYWKINLVWKWKEEFLLMEIDWIININECLR